MQTLETISQNKLSAQHAACLNFMAKLANHQQKIAMLTCYDATFAKLSEAAGIDVLLVGDSLGMVLQGAENTLSVTLNEMIYHTRCVAAGALNTLIIADMPINSYEHDVNVALSNAQKLIAAGAHMVKLEGGGDKVATVAHLVNNNIAVCAHLGFTPQSINQLGGYKIQGKTADSASIILQDAQGMHNAGASFVLLEMVPASLAKAITEQTSTPTIGIGAGVNCSGQVLVLQDLLGIYTGSAKKHSADYKGPRFVHNFLKDTGNIEAAIRAYVQAVKHQTFPASQHSY